MSAPPTFAINGRFMTQPLTGVQRYAWNVTRALDEALAGAANESVVLAPKGTADPGFTTLGFRDVGTGSGHLWEQAILPALWSGRLLNLCNTAPVLRSDQIVCVHDANVFVAPDSYSRAFRTLYTRLQPLLARRSARIATVSHAAARQLARHLPLDLADIAVLPNGHEHALAWDPARAVDAPARLPPQNVSGERPFVLALGSAARHKNIQLLVSAAPAFAALGIDVVVAGGRADIFSRPDLERTPNIHVVGRVSDDDLAYLFERALCLVFPSWTEGFGLPIVEAMARGCPVVASNCASMLEVGGRAALFASPRGPDEWIEHVRRLRGSPTLAAELAGRGREHVRAFSWAQTAAGYRELASQPLARPRRPGPVQPLEPRIAVIFATRGRPDMVSRTVELFLATQTLKPVQTIVSCVDGADAGDLRRRQDVTVVTGPAGLTSQRNTALSAVGEGTDVVAFFDDDFVADPEWLAVAAQNFRDDAQLVGFTGHVAADGATGPGIRLEDAMRIVETATPPRWKHIDGYSPYGCNMAFRREAIGPIRFDERLVLYGWLEDRDFGASLAKTGGRFVKCAAAVGVHLGTKAGKVSGERFGYSQVVNPLYMLRKGTMTIPQVADHLFRNLTSNFVRSFRPEPFIDRRGRVRGNLLAFADVLRGRLEPERAADLADRPGLTFLQARVR